MKRIFLYNNPNKKYKRRFLRQEPTEAEIKIWEKLRRKQLGMRFRRQYSIGPYFVDFYCPEKRLVIEIDGEQHKNQMEYDEYRTNYFEALDIKVIRYWNSEVLNSIDSVMDKIRLKIKF